MDSGLDAVASPRNDGGEKFASDLNVICPVQPSRKKHSASVVGQISDLTPRVSPERGAARDRHERCGEMRWTQMLRTTNAASADG
ncbi:hypothetical protein, partial [Bradyrhizobium sp. Leo121]|uniref:hypothetical protein n=1 Tax=Bradyrhizobium sp. Leo121 TaxID=1571195 RepID=UPI001A9392EC